jgi:phosphatidate cytidylyltransferase
MKRIVSAVILIPTILCVVLFGRDWLLFCVVAIVAALCYHEFSGMTGANRPAGYAAGAVILSPLTPQYGFVLLTLIALAALTLSIRAADIRGAFPSAAALAFGVIYVFAAWKTAIILHAMNPYWLMFGLTINWMGDTGAYYVGRRFGRHKLAPVVSPAKSWEGAIASLVTALLFGALLMPRLLPQVSVWLALALSAAVNIAGQVGDLAESAIKRSVGVKDSGTLLPGHGGWLDRVDSSMFALPVLYGILAAGVG